MATQDMSLYVRGKDEERKHGPKSVGFMKDGFQQWAESERPARGGGEPKTPLSRTNDMRHSGIGNGGALEDLFKVTKTKYADDVPPAAKKALAAIHKKMKGGAISFDDIKRFIDNIVQVYNDVKEYAGPIKALFKSDALQNLQGGKYKPVLDTAVRYMEMVGFGKHGEDELMSEDEEEMMRVGFKGSGNPPIRRLDDIRMMTREEMERLNPGFSFGGAMGNVRQIGEGRHGRMGRLPPPLHDFLRQKYAMKGSALNFEKAKEIAGDVVQFFRDNKAFIHAILESDAINSKVFAPPKDYPRKFAQGLSMLGLGGGRLPGMPEYEDCPEGYIDDGLLCRKPIKQVMKKDNLGISFPSFEGGEVIPKKMKGRGVSISGLKSALSGVAEKVAAAPSVKAAVKKVTGGRGPSRRGEIVRKVMREQGLSLAEASRYVKQHGLY
jgi:hypothetical protein